MTGFDWTGYLDLAESLAGLAGDEAAQRSAISRAYYAAFHRGRDFLDRKTPTVPRDGSAHVEVRNRLAVDSRGVAQDLRRLHGWRKNADYDDICPFVIATQATTAVSLARRVVQDIDRLGSSI